ncbi:hypothetical protein DWB85_08135 [Seongchinamella sediminis]|uniref:Uncharacterized protein n=1 Tax=Seongchinamella sediminis TaxID=2283635 RepID=A0A3L7DXF2_9GAMM|nr:hypothetical protein DWB85_08135 [Seongchinamella sediminis]
MQGGQVLAVLDSVFGALEDLFHREIRQRFQPKFLDLLELAGVRVGGVVLVVVVEAKQGKDLVDGLDVAFTGRAFLLSSPSWCR